MDVCSGATVVKGFCWLCVTIVQEYILAAIMKVVLRDSEMIA